MKTISDITGKSYEAEDCVFFLEIHYNLQNI